MYKEFDIKLNIEGGSSFEEITPVQGENGSQLHFQLLKQGEPLNLKNKVVEVRFKKNNGEESHLLAEAKEPEEGKASVKITNDVLELDGIVKTQIFVYSGETVIKTWIFEIRVYPSLASDSIESANDFTLLESALMKLADFQEEENHRNESETIRKENEIIRQDNENDREKQENARQESIINIENRFQNLTKQQQQDAEVVDARQGKASLGANIQGIKDDLATHKEDYTQQQQLPHFNHAAQEYVNLDKFWDNLRDGKIYTVEFNQFNVSPSPIGIKKDDNEGLVMEPSTNTVQGQDDYSSIGLFKPIEVNAYVDENDDYHVIAMEGDGRFKRDGTMGDVYIMSMVGYQKRYADENVWGISYSDTAYGGFEVIDEAVKPDGTIRPYLLHAKYVAGRNSHESNNLASISGVPAEYKGMSHNGQIEKFREKGTQYSGKTNHDDFYVQLIMWLKYATMNSRSVMTGCSYYYSQDTNLVAEKSVKRVIITNSQASNYLVGSTVSIGDYGDGEISTNRASSQNYNLAERVNILDIVDLEDGNSAIYVDSSNTFDTTLTTTIMTYPWNSGSCDSVLGVDGSPTSFTSGKEPFIINGIEMVVGGNEVIQNCIIDNNTTDNRTDVYVNYDCKTYATSITPDYDLVGQMATTNNRWKYGSKISIPDNHPSSILVVETEGSSTTGTGDGIYTNAPSRGGARAWRSLGVLNYGSRVGLRYLYANISPTASNWSFLGRLSATGRSRRRDGVS